MLLSIIVGGALIGVTVVIHALGTAKLAERSRVVRTGEPLRVWKATRILVRTALFLFFLHVVEVIVWAMAYWQLPQVEDLTSFKESVYFSMVTYTTVGYGDVTIQGPMRLLAGIQGLNGVLLTGWSTALLFVAVQAIWFPTGGSRISRTEG